MSWSLSILMYQGSELGTVIMGTHALMYNPPKLLMHMEVPLNRELGIERLKSLHTLNNTSE